MSNSIADMGSSGEEEMTIEEYVEAQAHIFKHTMNYIHSTSLKCAVELGIPGIIHNRKKPMTHSELVNSLQIPQSRSSHLRRLMRMLVHDGFFTMQKVCDLREDLRKDDEEEGGYVLTRSTRLLLKDHWTFPAGFAGNEFLKPWESFGEWLKGGDGETAFEAAHGKNLWNYGVEHVEFCNLFNASMAASSRVLSSVLVTKYKPMFEGVTSLVDVGGGIGSMGRAIAEAFPHIKCSGILHDWNDEDCLKILKRCREAIPSSEKGGKLIILDIVMDSKATREIAELQLFFDMLLMVNTNGIERSEREWEKLFKEAGFTSYKITSISSFRTVIEAFP
ncbi:hypothetical protein Sjap_000372 [Stephania japonica]|uniref:O-methyltransferase n=1 Tax=Stephania japonica TaxID=461633 RepID=A0AAP0KHX8_9MAGN|nr:COMT protein [Stephania japonica]